MHVKHRVPPNKTPSSSSSRSPTAALQGRCAKRGWLATARHGQSLRAAVSYALHGHGHGPGRLLLLNANPSPSVMSVPVVGRQIRRFGRAARATTMYSVRACSALQEWDVEWLGNKPVFPQLPKSCYSTCHIECLRSVHGAVNVDEKKN